MKFLSSMKNVLRISLVAAVIISTGAFRLSGNAEAISLGGPQDCDYNAVIYCGAQTSQSLISKYNNGTAQNSAKSIHDIYAYPKFAISSAEVQALNTTAVAGKVTKSGEVYINSVSTPIAKDALTAGREYMNGSTRVTYNGTTFYTRTPSVSFASASIPAYVVMKNNVFQYAILSSCANPVVATPTTKAPTPLTPNYTITKTVAVKGGNNFQHSVADIAPGTHVVYRLDIKSTGKAAVTNLNVKDVLPAHVTYVPGTLRHGTTAVAGTSFFTSTGVNAGSLAAGASTTFTFEAVVGMANVGTTCSNETLVNTGAMKATSLPAASSTAVVSTKCAPVTPQTPTPAPTPTPTPAPTPAPAPTVTPEVASTPPTCDMFNIAPVDNQTVKVTEFNYTPNDAQFVSAVINWDVNKTNVSSSAITNAAQVVGQTHQYAAAGTYLVGVTVNFTLNGQPVSVSGPQCQKQVTVAATPQQPPVVTPLPPVAPVAAVATPATQPTALVNTGAGSTIGIFAAVAAVSIMAYQWSLRRRLSL